MCHQCLCGCGVAVAEPEGRRSRYELTDPRIARALAGVVPGPSPREPRVRVTIDSWLGWSWADPVAALGIAAVATIRLQERVVRAVGLSR